MLRDRGPGRGGAANDRSRPTEPLPRLPFARGERLIKNEGAPTGVRGLQFYPARNGSGATCLWEADSVEDVQGYVDSTLGDASEYLSYEVDAELAFARQPLGISDSAAIGA